MLHKITSSGSYELFVIVKRYDGVTRRKQFKGFTIGSEENKYVFHYDSVYARHSNYKLFERALGMKFSTVDQDNDIDLTKSCAENFHGGWWFSACHADHMNGRYSHTEICPRAQGVHWNALLGLKKCLKETMLLIKKLS